jgi:hypothetical protein
MNKGPKLSALERVADRLLQLAQRYARLAGWHDNLADGTPPQVQKLILDRGGTLTIASGVITATRSYHQVDTEGSAASDDVDTITAATDGMVLFLHPLNSARNVVLKHGTGNLRLDGAADVTLDLSTDHAILIFDAYNYKWIGRGFCVA